MLRRPMGSSPSPINLPDDMDNLLAKHGVPAKELLTFYKKRIGHHEADTLDALQRLVAVESHSAELHRLRWALRSRDEEVKELQLALSDAKVYLYDERELSLRLQAENDELKAKEMEDRKKISHLLALTEPMAQEFTYFRNPSSASGRPATSGSSPGGKGGRRAGGGPHGASAPLGRAGFGMGSSPTPTPTTPSAPPSMPIPLGSGGARIVSSITLPGAGGSSGGGGVGSSVSPSEELRSTSLKRQLGEVQRMSDERAAGMMRDRATLIDAHEKRSAADGATIQGLQREVEELQAKLTHLTRDYLSQRHTLGISEREAREEAALCRAAKEAAEAQLASVSGEAQAEVRAALATTQAQARALSGVLNARAEQFEDAVAAVTAGAGESVRRLEGVVGKLKGEVKRWREKYGVLEQRRAWDLEGFNRDVGELRRALRTLELQWSAWEAGVFREFEEGDLDGVDILMAGGAQHPQQSQQQQQQQPPPSKPTTSSHSHRGLVSHEKTATHHQQLQHQQQQQQQQQNQQRHGGASGGGFRSTLTGFNAATYHSERLAEAELEGEAEEAALAKAMAMASQRASSSGRRAMAPSSFSSATLHSLATSTATTLPPTSTTPASSLISPIRSSGGGGGGGGGVGGGVRNSSSSSTSASGGGPRRVLKSSPQAAPLYLPSATKSRGGTPASTVMGGVGGGVGGGGANDTTVVDEEEEGEGGEGVGGVAPVVDSPATIERKSAQVESQLGLLKERISQLNSRVAHLSRAE